MADTTEPVPLSTHNTIFSYCSAQLCSSPCARLVIGYLLQDEDMWAESEQTITLISQEGEPFVVPLRVAITSPFIKAHSAGEILSYCRGPQESR